MIFRDFSYDYYGEKVNGRRTWKNRALIVNSLAMMAIGVAILGLGLYVCASAFSWQQRVLIVVVPLFV